MNTPLIALVTDFGRVDSYVAEVHLAIQRAVPGAHVLDVAHDLKPYDLVGAALVVERTLAELPRGAALVAVIDPGVGTARSPIAVSVDARWCVGPDNGVLPVRSPRETPAWRIDAVRARHGATTFDGRERFGPAAALLAAGLDPRLLGARLGAVTRNVLPHEAEYEMLGHLRYARGVVIACDRYGNAVTSLRLPPGVAPHEAEVIEPEAFAGPLVTAYGAVARGQRLAIVGSSGRVELAVSQGESSLAPGAEVLLRCPA